MTKPGRFGFVQFEFGFLLGPGDGIHIVRSEAGSEPAAVLVLATLGAPERRRLRGRRGREATEASPAAVPTSRATVVKPEPFASDLLAESWLDRLRKDGDAAEAEVEAAAGIVNRAIHAHRIARAAVQARDIAAEQALVVRVGVGAGDAVADGRYAAAWELPPERRSKGGRAVDPDDERFAALLGAREAPLVGEELVLRAVADLAAGRGREAALQARVALEALLAELGPTLSEELRATLHDDRVLIGEAANSALRGALTPELAAGLEASIGRMRKAIKARRGH